MPELIVRIAFDGFRVGERITDPDLIVEHFNSPFVVKVVAEPKNTVAALVDLIDDHA